MKLLEKIFSPIFLLCVLLTFFASNTYAQTETQINGTITDAKSNEPLIGVSIVQKGTTNGTVTDYDGNFTLSVPTGTTLHISYVGYEPQEIGVTGSQKSWSIQLKESQVALEEVVVIGYGAVKRKDVTTAIATVSTKDLDQRPIISAAQAIQGKAAGVSVVQPNGAPGADMSIRVRGTTSFNGSNDPLYVVDGVPVDNINFLSPNDIENIQILKDASSAAIYGSRAANGVILVTTKAGSNRDAKITFNAQLSLNKVVKSMDVLNTQQYKELQDEIGIISLPDGLTDKTDWFDEAYSTGNRQNYQVSISDGTEKMNYFISGGYVNEKGVLNTAYYKRYNFRLNLDSKVRKWLTLNANISYSDSEKNGLQTGLGANRGGVVLSVINTPTYAPIWNAEKPEQYYNNFYGIGNINNPLENMARTENDRDKENRLIASGSALITFMPDLTLKSSFTLDRRQGLKTTFLDPITTSWGRNQYGEGSDTRNTNTVLTFDNVLTYNKAFGKNRIEAMAGASWTDSDYRNSWINGSHYRNADIQTLNAANKIGWDSTGSGASEWGILSYFGRVSYNYDSKYLLTVNMRMDGSSKLHPDHRWGTFPSASAAWRISSEDFMKDIEWLDDLKIRGGWGKTGNQSGIHDYAYLQRYNINRIEWFVTGQDNALPSISQANLRTPDLKWETTTQINLGVDFTGFSNRLMVALDYYHKKTKDMLMNVTLPSGAAASNTITRNEGEMTNRGFEVSVSTVNLQGAFGWNTDFNISFNKNKLDRLDLQKIYNDAKTSDVINETVVRNEPGRALGGFFGYISDGVDPETGDMIYRDLNEDGKISSTDRTYIGDPNPDFTYGMTNTFSWKNINLSIFIQGSYGNDVFNASRIETEGMYDGKNQSTRVLDRWRIPGQITDVPKAGFNIKNSTYFVEDGSYLRVKDISLSYDLKLERLKRIGITRLQPYFTVSNLLTWTNYSGMDPEVNQWGNSGAVQGIDWGTYPHSKSFVFGINVEF
ncbi:TonB-dependent receptor [Massilibacteroides sp.]|uniref:SusC/RagA family TonB-linked outer membrane protein n=1 Tax=Massilibacteroides sp. TaxID=2034766 RepID=UPI002637D52B|nr:TonB-dependent receptor [Massilibacteroides sp.]MDD4514759.1 TonB-dependent receptor [Massilibacteroides sp.]